LSALVALPTEAMLRRAFIRAAKPLDAAQAVSIQQERYVQCVLKLGRKILYKNHTKNSMKTLKGH
jgi:hypothetical protein